MRLDKLYINGFGKFDKDEITFSPGLNVIYGPNESGKTTLQDFITAMLYRLDKSNHKRHIPWKTGKFGTANKLIYTLDCGDSYTIEKNFNRSTARVFAGEPYEDITERFPVVKKDILVMEEHTGLNLPAFESTVLIKQAGVRFDKKHSPDIVERLVRLSEYGDEDVDYKNATAYLDTIGSEIGGGNAGKYKKLVRVNGVISDLEKEKYDAEKNIARVRSLNLTVNELEGQKREIEESINELKFLKSHKNHKLYNYSNELKNRLDALEVKRKEIMSQLPMYDKILLDADVSKDYLNELEELYSDFKLYEKQLADANKQTDKTALKINSSNISLIDYLFACSPLIISIFTFAIGLIKPDWLIFTGSALLGVLILILSNFLKKKEFCRQSRITKLRNNNEYCSIKRSLETAAEGIRVKLNKVGFEFNEIDMVHAVVHEFKQAFETGARLRSALEEAQKEINLINNNLIITSDSFGAGIGNITDNYYAQGGSGKDIELMLKRNGLEYKHSISDIDSLLQIKINTVRKIEIEQSAMIKEMEMLSDKYRHPGDLENLLSVARKEKREYEATKEAAILAKEFLALALKEIQQNYVPLLNRRMGEILSRITNERYKKVDTGSSLDIVIKDAENGMIDPTLLSKGTIDQIYFSLRLASAEILSSKETLPLIIDEPFAHYDDARLQETLRFVCEIANNRQVIIFTCQERELEVLRDFNIYKLQ